MRKIIDLKGKQFGGWYVLGQGAKTTYGQIAWVCRCSCGTVREVAGPSLRKGLSVSCGCTKGAAIAKARTIHGHTGHKKKDSRTYEIWTGMKQRCYNPNKEFYPRYGGRGIKVCARWHEFAAFLADMGEVPEGMSIDRIDNDGDYELSNCKWSTATEQANNRSKRKDFIDLSGTKFGYWEVVAFSHYTGRALQNWLCRCHCGVVKPVPVNSLKYGKSKSCGCMRGAATSAANFKHGRSASGKYPAPRSKDHGNEKEVPDEDARSEVRRAEEG